jgi:hypothetical protein
MHALQQQDEMPSLSGLKADHVEASTLYNSPKNGQKMLLWIISLAMPKLL